jgi:DNA-binding MarR family transcriptional regulator
MPFEKSASMGFVTNRLARLFAQHLHAKIAPLGLAPAQFMTLLELWEGDGLTQAELTERLDVEQATMANTLARMERDGLVERTPHAQDRRARLIRLTEKARALEGPAKAAAASVNAAALADLQPADAARALDYMNAMVASLRQQPR